MTVMQWHWADGRSYDGPAGFDAACDVCRGNRVSDARNLGIKHGQAGEAPFGDLDDAGSGDLMTELGETGDTTDENYGYRVDLLNAYREAWEKAAGRFYPIGA